KIEQMRVDASGIYFPFVSNVFAFDSEVTGQSRARLRQYSYNVTADNLSASTGNLLKESDLGEVTNVTYAFAYSDVADSPVYTTYTYATIPSNSDIRDRPATITIS